GARFLDRFDLTVNRIEDGAGLGVEVTRKVIADDASLLVAAILGGNLDRVAHRWRGRGARTEALGQLPRLLAIENRRALRRACDVRRLVTKHVAAKLREGPATDRRAGRQVYRRRVDLQPDPTSRLRQRAHGQAAWRVVGTEVDFVDAPVGAMLPAS